MQRLELVPVHKRSKRRSHIRKTLEKVQYLNGCYNWLGSTTLLYKLQGSGVQFLSSPFNIVMKKNVDGIHSSDSIFRKFLDCKTKGVKRIIHYCNKGKRYRIKQLFSRGKMTQTSDYKDGTSFDFIEPMLCRLKFLVENRREHRTNSKYTTHQEITFPAQM